MGYQTEIGKGNARPTPAQRQQFNKFYGRFDWYRWEAKNGYCYMTSKAMSEIVVFIFREN
jgi:hypothetical protein